MGRGWNFSVRKLLSSGNVTAKGSAKVAPVLGMKLTNKVGRRTCYISDWNFLVGRRWNVGVNKKVVIIGKCDSQRMS